MKKWPQRISGLKVIVNEKILTLELRKLLKIMI